MNTEIPVLSGCVLLDRCEIDWDVFRLQFFDDWHVELDGEITGNQLTFTINNANVICQLENEQVALAIENANRNYAWPGAKEAISAHTAHVQIYLTDCENAMQRHVLFTMVAGSMLKQEGTIGLYQYPITREANAYIEAASSMMKEEIPVLDWIYLGVYQDEDGVWNAYTYGLEDFGKPEIEIIKSSRGLIEMYRFLANVVNHLITYDETLSPGEPIGLDDAHTCMVTLSPAVALDGESFKLEY